MPVQGIPQLESVRISENTYRLEDGGVRALLFIGESRALLVDTGFGASGGMRNAVRALTDKQILLVNTHADADHIGDNAEFGAAHMHPSEMARYFQTVDQNAPVAALWEGDVLDIGGRSFEIILIPGHTPGSIALIDRENRALISGDSVSEAPIFMFGDGRSIGAYIASMEKLLAMRGAFDTVYPSHGPFPTFPAQIDKALAAVRKLAAGELTPEKPPFQIPAKLYKHDGAAFLYK